MKEKINIFIRLHSVPKMEYDDGPFPEDKEIEVPIEFNHFFLNRKRKLIKAMLAEANKRAKWGLSTIASLEPGWKGPGVIMDKGIAVYKNKVFSE